MSCVKHHNNIIQLGLLKITLMLFDDINIFLSYLQNTEESNTGTAENASQRRSQPFQEIQSIMVHPSTSSMVIPKYIFVTPSPSESTHIEQVIITNY